MQKKVPTCGISALAIVPNFTWRLFSIYIGNFIQYGHIHQTKISSCNSSPLNFELTGKTLNSEKRQFSILSTNEPWKTNFHCGPKK